MLAPLWHLGKKKSGLLTLAKIGLSDLVADESAYVEDCRVRIELHRLDQILLHDADLQ